MTRLGKRIYRDKLELQEEAEDGDVRRRRYRIYGDDPSYHHEEGTDFAAVRAEKISVTPLHFELTDVEQHGGAARVGPASLLGPTAQSRRPGLVPAKATRRTTLAPPSSGGCWSTTTTATTSSTIRRSRIPSTTTCCAS